MISFLWVTEFSATQTKKVYDTLNSPQNNNNKKMVETAVYTRQLRWVILQSGSRADEISQARDGRRRRCRSSSTNNSLDSSIDCQQNDQWKRKRTHAIKEKFELFFKIANPLKQHIKRNRFWKTSKYKNTVLLQNNCASKFMGAKCARPGCDVWVVTGFEQNWVWTVMCINRHHYSDGWECRANINQK